MVSLLVNILTRTFKMQTFNNHYAGIFDKTGEIIYIYIYIYIYTLYGEKLASSGGKKRASQISRKLPSRVESTARATCLSRVSCWQKMVECDNKVLISCFVYG